MALSPKVFLGIALVAGVATAGVIGVNHAKSSAPAATPTPAIAKRSDAPPPPLDPSKLPQAYRTDEGIPANIATSLVFIEEMLTGPHRQTMEQVTCHCCKKTLAQCYMDTATKAPKACSPLCSVCQHEGKDVVAAARVGMPVDELRTGLERTYGSGGGSHEGDGHDGSAHPM